MGGFLAHRRARSADDAGDRFERRIRWTRRASKTRASRHERCLPLDLHHGPALACFALPFVTVTCYGGTTGQRRAGRDRDRRPHDRNPGDEGDPVRRDPTRSRSWRSPPYRRGRPGVWLHPREGEGDLGGRRRNQLPSRGSSRSLTVRGRSLAPYRVWVGRCSSWKWRGWVDRVPRWIAFAVAAWLSRIILVLRR